MVYSLEPRGLNLWKVNLSDGDINTAESSFVYFGVKGHRFPKG